MALKDENIADDLVSHAIDLSRLDADHRKKVISTLNKMQKELKAKLNSGTLTDFGKQSVNRLLKEANEVISSYYAKAAEVVDFEGVAKLTSKATGKALEEALIGVDVGLPSSTVLNSVVSNVLIEGNTAADWWTKQSSDMKFKFSSSVKQGILQGETNQQIIKRVTDSITVSKRNATSLVQTGVAAVASDARMVVYQENDDVISALVWVGTLDGKICDQCAPRVELEWELDGTPIGHNVPFRNTPIHFNDRCLLTPRTKTFKELGIDIPEPKIGPQATAGGPVSDDFDSFLERKGPEFQDEIFGKGRAELYRKGIVTRTQLLDQNGNTLTLAELNVKYNVETTA